MTYEILDLPENLAPGKYGTRVVDGEWIDGDIHLTLRFDGPYDPAKHLIPLVKEATE